LTEAPTFGVGELNQAIAEALVDAFPRQVWVRGEVAQYRATSAGHAYFDLVEKAERRGDVRAKLSVALFRNDRAAVNRTLRDAGTTLADGAEVRIRARVDFWPPAGRLQLVMNGIDPLFTVGKLAAERARVLQALTAEGLLRRQAELDLALVPLRVGLVTSGGSAAYHDFVQELEASAHAFRVAHVDVRVQGQGAFRRIVYGLRTLGALDLDVIVLARGGGSRSDLAPFDSEVVARVIAESGVPVITGIGHEVDRTVADEVAHTCMKTPTAAAAMLVDTVDAYCERLARISHRVSLRARSACTLARRDLANASLRLTRGAPVALAREQGTLDGHRRRAVDAGRRRTREASARAALHRRTLGAAATRGMRTAGTRLDGADARLRALDPRRVLERGYTITRTNDGKVLRAATDVGVGDTLVTETAGGDVHSRVEEQR
jgi:exodeoxyribonuclease VII large subunit